MKVICINIGYKGHAECPLPYVKEGSIYTVVKHFSSYSDLAQREVEVYELEELVGFYEAGMFAPLSNIDEMLLKLLRTKPINKKIFTNHQS